MPPQTSVDSAPPVGLPGQIVDGDHHHNIDSFRVEETNGIAPGLACYRGTGGDWTARKAPTFAADDDAIIAAHATTAGNLVLDDASELDGVIGEARIHPPSKLDLTLSSHADFNATTWPLVFEDEDGVRRTYDFLVPDAGNTALRTPFYVSRVISLTQPAQGGTGGSFKLGTTTERAIGKRDGIGISMHSHKALIAQSTDENEVYEDEDTMPAGRKVKVWVTVENAFTAGDAVFVRCTATGDEVAGAIRVTDTDSGDCAQLMHANLVTSGDAGDLGQLEVDL